MRWIDDGRRSTADFETEGKKALKLKYSRITI